MRHEDIPEINNPKIRFPVLEGDKLMKEVLNGGYNVHPVPPPNSEIKERIRKRYERKRAEDVRDDKINPSDANGMNTNSRSAPLFQVSISWCRARNCIRNEIKSAILVIFRNVHRYENMSRVPNSGFLFLIISC